MKICTWNINGIRAIHKKGFIPWLLEENPDILCLQETKAHQEQLEEEILQIQGYSSVWNSATKKGYSGVAVYYKEQPKNIIHGLDIEVFDNEGRVIVLKYENFTLLNIYFPNGQMGEVRLQYKLDFYDAVINYSNKLKDNGENLIICGDFNTAHNEIDLKNPKANEKRSGFLSIEREKLDEFFSNGYIDVFRKLRPDQVQYTWWSYRTKARERNAGWRIDGFYVNDDFLKQVKDCIILDHVEGSDHCPVMLYLK